jgi:hypothetical protein
MGIVAATVHQHALVSFALLASLLCVDSLQSRTMAQSVSFADYRSTERQIGRVNTHNDAKGMPVAADDVQPSSPRTMAVAAAVESATQRTLLSKQHVNHR